MRVNRILSLFAVAACLLTLAACGQKTNCSGISFGTGGGSGSGSGGGTNTGGSTCGSGGGGGNKSAIAYLYSVDGTAIDGAFFDGNQLQAIAGFTKPDLGSGGAADMFIVNKKYLYQPWAPNGSSSSQINAFAIAANGGLAPITGSPFSLTAVGDVFAADPGGKFLFVGQSATQTIAVMQINSSTGALTQVSGSPFPVIDVVTQLTVDGTGHYLYATIAHSSGLIVGWSIDQTTGAITPLAGSPYFLGISRMVAHPSGNFLMGVGGGAITTLPLNPTTGDLTTGSSFVPASPPAEILIHPTGNFIYTFSDPPSAIEGFTVSNTGTIAPLSNSPFNTIMPITAAKMDQSGKTMIGLTSGAQFFVVVVDPKTGLLTQPTATPYIGVGSHFFGITN